MATAARQDAKRELRAGLKQRLSSLSEEDVISQSEKAQNTILSLKAYKDATRVGIYLSMPKAEAQTDKLVRDALSTGKKVFVPCIHTIGTEKPKQKVMEMLSLNSPEEYDGLEKDSWNIPKLPKNGLDGRENAMGGTGMIIESEEATKVVDSRTLDVIVVPGVAFDQEMNRMGHGAGFYDAFLTRFFADSQRQKPFLVGLCLAEQVLPSGQLVMQDWDWKVDAVAVGDGSLLRGTDMA